MADYYKTLGVAKNASDEEIKKAYRTLAMKHHPDRNGGDKEAEKKFKEATEAYEVLKDKQKRAAYDQFGDAAFKGGAGGAGGGFSGFSGFSDFAGGFSDIFENFFSDIMGGGAKARSGKPRGEDLRYDMSISLEEAFKGLTKIIKITKKDKCDVCHGSGAKAGSGTKTCHTCGGSGRVRVSAGFFGMQSVCPTCEGQGEVVDKPCDECLGSGVKSKTKELEIKIPAGVEDGMRIRLAAEGNAVRGGENGDLYVFISVKKHKFFERAGNDILFEVPISMVTATLGGEVEIPSIDGSKLMLTIPKGIQAGTKLKLKDKGMPNVRSHRVGDAIITVRVETPLKINKHQEELLREFEREGFESPSQKSFMEKLKDWFQGN